MQKSKIKLKNFILGIKSQMPLKRFLRNMFITGNARGLFHINSHINASSGQPKVAYGSYKSAKKTADKMGEKRNCYFSVYKCIYCDGWHIGRNQEDKKE